MPDAEMAAPAGVGAGGRDWRHWLERHGGALRFCVLFVCYTLVAFTLLYWFRAQVGAADRWLFDHAVMPAARKVFPWLQLVLRAADLATWATALTPALLEGSPALREQCQTVYLGGVYAAAVLAYPALMEDRVWRVFSGGLVLYLLDLACVPVLSHVPPDLVTFFGGTHANAWHGLVFALVALLWLGWIARLRTVS